MFCLFSLSRLVSLVLLSNYVAFEMIFYRCANITQIGTHPSSYKCLILTEKYTYHCQGLKRTINYLQSQIEGKGDSSFFLSPKIMLNCNFPYLIHTQQHFSKFLQRLGIYILIVLHTQLPARHQVRFQLPGVMLNHGQHNASLAWEVGQDIQIWNSTMVKHRPAVIRKSCISKVQTRMR